MKTLSSTIILALLGCSAFLTAAEPAEKGTADFQTRKTWTFPADDVFFSNEFPAARLNEVTRTAANTYRLDILPETRPVNDSAWFAFRVWSKTAKNIKITLSYTGGTHRYKPKSSVDGATWKLVDNVTSTRRQANFALDVSATPLVVAGQPIISVDDQMKWTAAWTKLPFVTMREAGRSVQGRPLPMLETKTAKGPEARTLILLTGQHPPEFTGVRAFRQFLSIVLGDTPLARDFRQHYNMTIFPLVNPDGWYNGHWRTNANGIDPNRSWVGKGLDTVPEVQQVIAEIHKVESPVAMIDFHSTDINVLYTGEDDDREPRFLIPEFQEALARRVPDFTWKRDISHTVNGTPSRSWGTRELNIPSITWEWADIASSERLEAAPRVGAEEWMRLLLRLCRDDTTPAARYDFETLAAPGTDTTGAHPATVNGAPSASPQAVFGESALSFAPPDSYLTVPDFNYASKGATLSFWFRMDPRSVADGECTYLFSHGGNDQANHLNIAYWKAPGVLRISVRDANDPATDSPLELPGGSFLDGKWHHLGVIIHVGKGTSVLLDGMSKAMRSSGNDGLDPVGPLHLGIGSDGAPNSRFSGALDDFRIYDSALTPYDLTTIRFPDAPH